MRVLRVDHVAIAVRTAAPVLEMLRLFGLEQASLEELTDQSVRSRMVAAGNAHLELLEGLSDEAPLARFLHQRGEGLHHVCLEVDDLGAAVGVARANGLRLVEDEPRADAVGRRVFVHPSSAHGVLLGFMERHHRAGVRAIGPEGDAGARTYSLAVVRDGLMFISGLNAIDADGVLQAPGDVVGQTRAIYRKMGGLLAAAGASFADLVKTTDYIVDRSGYRETAGVRREFLGPVFPAATGVVVKELLGRGVLIEIDAIAVLDRVPGRDAPPRS